MPRMKRDVQFTNIRIQTDDHEFLHRQKLNISEQIDAVLHRIIGSYRNSALGDAEFMYNEQVRVTQRWIQKCTDLQDKLRARNQVLDQVLEEP